MSLPVPELDDITFAELIEEALRLIPQHAPDWTNHNPSDPGITLVELFAWLAEMQIYSLNQITPRHHLKYQRLLGISPQPAAAARAWVTFASTEGQAVSAPRGTKVATGEGVAFETEKAAAILPVTLNKVIVYDRYRFYDHSDTNRRTGVFYHAFGVDARAGAALYLGLTLAGEVTQGDRLKPKVTGKQLQVMVRLYEADLPEVPAGDEELGVSVRVCWKYWNGAGWIKLPHQEEKNGQPVSNLLHSGGLELTIPADIEMTELYEFGPGFWICAELVAGGYEIPPRLDTVLLNTVRAVQGVTQSEVLGTSTGLPAQEFMTTRAPVLAGSQLLQVEGLEGEPKVWTAAGDLDASRPEDRHYLMELETGKITFGDGVNGMLPPAGRKLKFSYRTGGGPAGNVSAGMINLVYGLPGVNVNNLFPASGGKEAEAAGAVWPRLHRELSEVTRGVTAADFEQLAGQTPGVRVARAKAVALPDTNTVKVVVVPFSFAPEPVPGSGFLKTVKEYLHRRRLITTLVEVTAPRYVKVSVAVKVRAVPGSDPIRVRDKVYGALDEFLHPLKGGPGGKGWDFGRDVHRSKFYVLLGGIDGVDCVMDLVFTMDRRMDETSLVSSGRHTVEVIEPDTTCGGS